ncbi:MAG: hypothetical protein DGJ47_001023, partial [Rickettsiaceae bacterium]
MTNTRDACELKEITGIVVCNLDDSDGANSDRDNIINKLSKCSNLKTLIFCNLKSQHIQKIFSELPKEIAIHNIHAKIIQSELGLVNISNSLKGYHLTELRLNGNIITRQDIQGLETFLKYIPLTELFFTFNHIKNEGAKALANLLNGNKTLTTLDLSTNNIGDEGSAALADSLHENTTLTTLDLSENNIGDEGAAALAESLKENTTLTTLDLVANNIGDEGAAALAESLKE